MAIEWKQDAKEKKTLMKSQDLQREEVPVFAASQKEFTDLGELFDAHIAREFADHDLDGTMETMVPEPYVYSIPSMTGGFGAQASAAFTVSTS